MPYAGLESTKLQQSKDFMRAQLASDWQEPLDLSFTLPELAAGLMSSAFCIWYFTHKHWLANNVLGLAFSVQGMEHLSLGTVTTGVILLSGLFFYDIFWVFCTPVMVRCQHAFNCLHRYKEND